MSLASKIALITGAGSGIGAAVARLFAREQAFVYVADINPLSGTETTEAIRRSGGKATFVQLDVTREDGCNTVANTVISEQGRLDILINNAGIGHVGTILQTTSQDLDRLYTVNVRGVFNMSKAFITGMIERKHGVIINMASVAGLVGLVDRLAYATTKFAVVGLTKSMALDHAKDGIRINCICPARVATPFVQARLKEYPDPKEAFREMSATQPVGRMGTPEEIADAALYLARDEAAFITGSALVIDGGFCAGVWQ